MIVYSNSVRKAEFSLFLDFDIFQTRVWNARAFRTLHRVKRTSMIYHLKVFLNIAICVTLFGEKIDKIVSWEHKLSIV